VTLDYNAAPPVGWSVRGIPGRPNITPLPLPNELLLPGRELLVVTRRGKVAGRVLGKVHEAILIEFDQHTLVESGLLEFRVGTSTGAFWVVASVEPAGHARFLVVGAQTSRSAEDRSYPRLPLATTAEVRCSGVAAPVKAQTIDVSAEGVGLLGIDLHDGEVVRVRLEVPDGDLLIAVESRAVVVRRGVQGNGQAFVGLQFTSLDAPTQRLLLSVARRRGMPATPTRGAADVAR
jgi:PilZ domain